MIGNIVLAVVLALTLVSWWYAGRTIEGQSRRNRRRRSLTLVALTVATLLLYRLW